MQTSTENNKSKLVRVNKDLILRLEAINKNVNTAIRLLFDKVDSAKITPESIRAIVKEEVEKALQNVTRNY